MVLPPILSTHYGTIYLGKNNGVLLGFCVGIISLVGFTPDIFFHSLTGRILDAEPGIIGFQNYYLVTMLISILGLLASLKLR